jgi:hypothetical protein
MVNNLRQEIIQVLVATQGGSEGDVVFIAGYGRYIAEFPFTELYESSVEGDIGMILGNIYENPELVE